MMRSDTTVEQTASAAKRRKPALVTVAAWLLWAQAAFGFAGLIGLLVVSDELPTWLDARSTVAAATIVGCGILATVAPGGCAVMLLRRHRNAMWTTVIVELCLLSIGGYLAWAGGSRSSPSLAIPVVLCLCQRSVRHWFRTPDD